MSATGNNIPGKYETTNQTTISDAGIPSSKLGITTITEFTSSKIMLRSFDAFPGRVLNNQAREAC